MVIPSKKVSILLIIVVLIVTTAISSSIYLEDQNNSNKIILSGDPNEPKNLLIAKSNKNIDTTDSDEDGLADWEENLFGTDPLKKDTDNDGITDKEEFDLDNQSKSINRTNEEFIILDEPIYEYYKEGTLSDKVAKNLASNFFQFKYNGTLSKNNSEELVNAITSSVQEITKPQPKYSENNIKSYPNPSKEDIKFYGNSLASLQLGFLTSLTQIDRNLEPQQYLSMVSNAYKNLSSQLILLTVPNQIKQQHLSVANNFDLIGQQLLILKDAESDPVNSLFAMQLYEKLNNSQTILYGSISNYFKQNDIIFNDNESGAIWNNL